MAAAAWMAWKHHRIAQPAPVRTRLRWEALALLLLLPLGLNTHAPLWTAFLKHLLVVGSASSLLRWFAAYILPAVVGAALSLDRLLPRMGASWLGAAAGIVITCACLLAGDRGFYGASGVGVYDPAPIEASWRQATRSGQVPPIRALAVPLTASGAPDMSIGRENLLAIGQSPLFCYNPLFGYRLESFHQGSLHAGPVLDGTPAGTRMELNLNNPACMVFPGANRCAPGDTFLAAQRAYAAAFAGYRPFAFARPWWAHAADWVSIASLAGLGLSMAALLRKPRAHPGPPP